MDDDLTNREKQTASVTALHDMLRHAVRVNARLCRDSVRIAARAGPRQRRRSMLAEGSQLG